MAPTNPTPERPKRPAPRAASGGRRAPGTGANREAQKKPPQVTVMRGIKGTLSVIGKTFLTIFLIMVITGSIVASVLTVYVVNFMDDQTEFNLRDLKLKYTTTLYAQSAEGESYPLQMIKGDENRIWVSFNEIPEQMQLAAMAAEDRRFQAHQGVDWKLTFAAFANLVIPFRENGVVGGSTITQQLIKNITNDKEVRVDRKIREIFRALALEKEYSKDDIMESYLNTIALGNNCLGVQAAANLYFGKNVNELDIAECAAIIAITQNPSKYELLRHEAANKDRRNYILDYMLETELANLETRRKGEDKNEFGPVTGGKLTDSEYKAQKKELEAQYEAAKEQKLVIKSSTAQQTRSEIYSYFVDYVIEDVIADLMEQHNYEYQAAWNLVYNGGLSIYTTVDERVQNVLDKDFITNEINYDPATSIFQKIDGRYIINGGKDYGDSLGEQQPQSAMVIMDYSGHILGMAGARGEKTGDRTFNLATDGVRQTGSSIKPISVYAPAIDLDLVHWSYIMEDSAFGYLLDGQLVRTAPAMASAVQEVDEDGNVVEQTIAQPGNPWPVNYYKGYVGNVTIDRAIQNSINTVAVKTLDLLTPQVSYDFLKNSLGIELPKADIDYSPLALGGMSGGISVLDMTAAYQIFGNGGLYYEPTSYYKVVDNMGNVLLEANDVPRRAISEDSAEVMNKLLQSTVTGGTGSPAAIPNMPTMGKTGTSSMDKDQWFLGGTPYYVAGVWFGYDKANAGIPRYSPYPPPQIWKRVMAEVSEGMERKEFPTSGGVVSMSYCAESGDLALSSCPRTGTGWYKESALPGNCSVHSGATNAEEVG